MTKLSDAQRVILGAASQRDDGAVLSLTISVKGTAVDKLLGSLEATRARRQPWRPAPRVRPSLDFSQRIGASGF